MNIIVISIHINFIQKTTKVDLFEQKIANNYRSL